MLFAFGAALLYSQHTDVTKLQFWAAVGAIAGVFLFLRGFSMLRCKRLIMNTPSSKIRSASMGLVEISGTAKGPQTRLMGITGEACYYYRASGLAVDANLAEIASGKKLLTKASTFHFSSRTPRATPSSIRRAPNSIFTAISRTNWAAPFSAAA